VCASLLAPVAFAQDLNPTVSDEAELDTTPHQRLVIGPRGGFGFFNEQRPDRLDQDANRGAFGIAARWFLTYRTRMDFGALASIHSRTFDAVGIGQSGGTFPVARDEWIVDGHAFYAWDLWENANHGVWFNVGWRHAAFLADGFNQHLSGASAGLNIELRAARRLLFHGFGDFTYNLIGLADRVRRLGESLSGDIEHGTRFGGGVRIVPTDYLELGVSYAGQFLQYERSEVFVHEVLFDAGFTFRF